jgi:hypothetical protein
MKMNGKHDMASLGGFLAAAALVVAGAQAMAQALASTPPASKPLSTSLGMVVFPAKG